MDFFVVPTIGFDLLYAFHRSDRPQRPRLGQRHKESDGGMGCTSDHGGISLGWAPDFMIRDRDRIYGGSVIRRLRAMGIRDKPTAPVSPWQNGFAERLIGSIVDPPRVPGSYRRFR